ncbi:MAG TPA: hypothetical protein VIW29_11850, partial [Polyangiaceae bacterium]
GQRYPDFDGFSFQRDDETGRLLGGYAARFATAPACQAQPQQAGQAASQPSAFVRVRRPARGYPH